MIGFHVANKKVGFFGYKGYRNGAAAFPQGVVSQPLSGIDEFGNFLSFLNLHFKCNTE